MGRPSKLTAATTAAICDVIAAGGTRTIAARAAGVYPDTLNGWLRRAAQEDTETTLEADDYTLRELCALAKTAHVPGYGRLRKADPQTRRQLLLQGKGVSYEDHRDEQRHGKVAVLAPGLSAASTPKPS